MKRFVSQLIVIIMVIGLCACGEKDEQITVPASFFDEMTEDEIMDAAKEEGFKSCVVNEDGSVTYTMTAKKKAEILKEYEDSVDESINKLLEGDGKVESFTDIKYTNNFDEFDVYVDSSKYSLFDNLYVLTFYISGAYCQIFNGVSLDKIDVKVNFIDKDNNEVLYSGSYRDWINNINTDSNSIDDNTNTGGKSENKVTVVNLGETFTCGNVAEITLSSAEWVDEIYPSNTSDLYSYFPDNDGEKYFVIHGTLKNIASDVLDIELVNDSTLTINGTYNSPVTMKLESTDGSDFYGQAKPLQTLNLFVFASVSDEVYNIFSTADVTMNIVSDKEYISYYYSESNPYETFSIKITK